MQLAEGDLVAYSAKFVHSIGGGFDIAERRGIVADVPDDRTVDVLWQDADEPQRVLTVNLAKPGPNVRFTDVYA